MPINGFICPSLAFVRLIATVSTCNNPQASVVVRTMPHGARKATSPESQRSGAAMCISARDLPLFNCLGSFFCNWRFDCGRRWSQPTHSFVPLYYIIIL